MSDLVYAMAEKFARLSGYSTPNESDYRAVAKALAARLEQVNHDTVRLNWLERWIEENSSGFEIFPIGPDNEYGPDGNTVLNVVGYCLADQTWLVKTLREAIDAAMKSETVSATEGER